MADYRIKMDDEAHKALAWVADRYTSAEVLYDGSQYDEEAGELTVPEHVAWEYREALPEDNGVEDAIVPPCVGGPLLHALLDLHDAIV